MPAFLFFVAFSFAVNTHVCGDVNGSVADNFKQVTSGQCEGREPVYKFNR